MGLKIRSLAPLTAPVEQSRRQRDFRAKISVLPKEEPPMHYKILSVAISIALFMPMTSTEAGPFDRFKKGDKEEKKEEKRKGTAAEAIEAFREKDPSIETFFEKSEGYAVFPTIGKGGIGIGGAYGKGEVYRKGKLIGYASLKQASYGFQLGGQTFREIIFFQTEEALNKFTVGKFEIGAQVSAVALKKGAAASAEFSNGMAVFTMTKKGLMYEAAVAGQKFKFFKKEEED